ncbi:hypothetical protein AGMMS50229_04310 [Campylobacterota bacterium]|nr:hypothetical protein AGMMS50229_04310 [Campylobacterota bacterium]
MLPLIGLTLALFTPRVCDSARANAAVLHRLSSAGLLRKRAREGSEWTSFTGNIRRRY